MPTAATDIHVVASREYRNASSGERTIYLTVGWTAATSGGTPPDSYTVQQRLTGSGTFYYGGSTSGDRTKVEIFGLLPNTSYDFRVIAYWGSTTATSTTVAITTSVVATRTTLVGVSGLDVGSVTFDEALVSWNDMALNEIGYLLELRQSGAFVASQFWLPGNATSKALSGLAAGVAYEVRVAAYNQDYEGKYYSPFTEWFPFETTAASIEGVVPSSIHAGKTVRLDFNYDPDPVESWTLTGDTNSYCSITSTTTTTAYAIVRFDVVGTYSLLVTIQVGTNTFVRAIEIVVVSEPIVVTDYPYYYGYYSARQFTRRANESLDVRFRARPEAAEWICNEVPPGFYFDVQTGRLQGSPFAPMSVPITLRARNDIGVGPEETFYLTFTPVDGPLFRTPYQRWLHDEPTLVDLWMDVRSRKLTSYYMDDGGELVLVQGETMRFAAVVADNGLPLSGVEQVRLAIFPRGKLGGISYLEAAFDGDPVVRDPGGTYYPLTVTIDTDDIEAAFKAATTPEGELALECHGELEVVLADGSCRKSLLFLVRILRGISS